MLNIYLAGYFTIGCIFACLVAMEKELYKEPPNVRVMILVFTAFMWPWLACRFVQGWARAIYRAFVFACKK